MGHETSTSGRVHGASEACDIGETRAQTRGLRVGTFRYFQHFGTLVYRNFRDASCSGYNTIRLRESGLVLVRSLATLRGGMWVLRQRQNQTTVDIWGGVLKWCDVRGGKRSRRLIEVWERVSRTHRSWLRAEACIILIVSGAVLWTGTRTPVVLVT